MPIFCLHASSKFFFAVFWADFSFLICGLFGFLVVPGVIVIFPRWVSIVFLRCHSNVL